MGKSVVSLNVDLRPQFDPRDATAQLLAMRRLFKTLEDVEIPGIAQIEADLIGARAQANAFERELMKVAHTELPDLTDVEDDLHAAARAAKDFEGQLEVLQRQAGAIKVEAPEIPQPKIEPVDIKVNPAALDDLADQFKRVQKELKDLEETQAAAAAQMILDGKKETAEYKDLIKTLGQTREKLKDVSDAMKEVSESGEENIFARMFAFESIAKAGEFIDSITEKGNEALAANKLLANSTGLVGEKLEALKAQSVAAFKDGLGENLAEATQIMGQAQGMFGKVFNPAEMKDFAVGVNGLGPIMDKEINEIFQKSQPLITNFKLNGTEAFNLLAEGARRAKTPSDDYLDSIAEYSGLLKQAGYDAQQLNEIAIRAAENGSFSTDKAFDAAKESQIRLKAGDTAKALADIEGPVSETIQGIVKAGEAGTLSVQQVLQQSAQAIETSFNAGQITETMRSQLQVAVSGTPAEDLGSELYAKIFAAPIDSEAIKARAAQAGADLTKGIGKPGLFSSIGKEIELVQTKASAFFAPFISGAGGVLQSIGQIGPGISILQEKFGVFDVAGKLIKGKLLPAILSVIPGLVTQTAATGAAEGAQISLNLAMLANPAFLVAAGIGAVVAAVLIFGDSTKDLEDAITDCNSALDEFNAKTDQQKAVTEQTKNLRALADEYDRLKNSTDPAGQKRFAEVAAQLAEQVPESAETLSMLGSSASSTGKQVGDAAAQVSIATDVVRNFAKEKQALADEDAANALAVLEDEAGALVDSYRESGEELNDLKAKRQDYTKAIAEGGAIARENAGEDVILSTIGVTDTLEEKQKDLNKEIAEESRKRREAEVSLQKSVQAMIKGGKSVDEIRIKTGLSTDEVKKLAGGLVDANGKIVTAAASTGALAAQAARAKKSAEDLAAAYDKVREAADKAYSNNFKAVLALQQEQRAAQRELANLNKIKADALTAEQQQRKVFLEQRLKDLPKEIQEEIDATKSALKDKRELDKQETLLKLKVGEIQFDVNDLTQQARDIRREIGDILFDLANADVTDAVKQAQEKIDRDLENDLAKIGDQIAQTRKVVRDAAADPVKQVKGAGELLAALEAKEVALRRQAEAEKRRIAAEARSKQLEDFKKLLAQEQEALNAGIDAEIEALEARADEIKATDEDSLVQRESLRLQALNLRQAKELNDLVSSNEDYLTAYGALQVAIREMDKATTDEEREDAANHVAFLRSTLGRIEANLIANNTEALALQRGFARDRVKIEQEFNDAMYQEQSRKLALRQARDRAAFERSQEQAAQVAEFIASLIDETGSTVLGEAADAEIEKLDRLLDQKIISEERHAAEVKRIQEKSARDQQVIQERSNALRAEADREAAIADLEFQVQQAEERRKLALDHGQIEEANKIGVEIDELTAEIEEKGTFLTGMMGGFQNDVTDIINNLFNGDGEAVKSSFKKPFAALAGALQQLATAKITEVLLSLIGPTGLLGLVGSFAARPIVSGLINNLIGPVIDKLLAFNTGGRVEGPTLALIGDPRPGGPANPEWVLGDDQMRMIIADALARQNAGVVAELQATRRTIENLDTRFYVLQRDVSDARGRQKAVQRRRLIRGRR